MLEFPVDHLVPATPDNTRRPDVPVQVLVDAGTASASSGLSVFVSVAAPRDPSLVPRGRSHGTSGFRGIDLIPPRGTGRVVSMTRIERRPRGPGRAWARALVLVALLFGLGAMHTLGHLQHEAHAAAGPAAAHDVMGNAVMGHDAAAPGDNAADLPELDPTSACPTLGAFTLVLVGVAAVAFHRWPGGPTPPGEPTLRPSPLTPPAPDEPSPVRLQVLRV